MPSADCGRCGKSVPEWDTDAPLPEKRTQRASWDPNVYHFECLERIKRQEWKEILAEHRDTTPEDVSFVP